MAYVDLNGLKEINDGEGHAQGDRMLSVVAEVLSAVFEGSTVYRLGGDEFLAIVPDVDEAGFRGKTVRAQELFEERACSTALGSFYASEPCQVEYAVGRADRKMYEAKRAYYVEHPELDRDRTTR